MFVFWDNGSRGIWVCWGYFLWFCVWDLVRMRWEIYLFLVFFYNGGKVLECLERWMVEVFLVFCRLEGW